MKLYFLPSIALWAVFGNGDQDLSSEHPIPCNNFYEYICHKNITRVPSRLRDVRAMEVSDDIDQYQEYVFHASNKQRLWQSVNPDIVSKWLVQFNTYWKGVNWNEHQKKHESFLNLDAHEKYKNLENSFEGYDFQILTKFYKSLKLSVEYLTELKIPISTRNHFYHGLFDEIRDIHILNIRTMSKFSEDRKNELIENVRNLKIIFPYLEYNDVKVWRDAKTAYEKEYYRLKIMIYEPNLSPIIVDKIIRVAAVNPAMEIFEKYITSFTSRFVFQHITAAASGLSFNYQNEIHISVFTMFNPIADPKSVYDQFLYVLCHELQHVHYNVDPPVFDEATWASEKQCVVDRIDHFAAAYKTNRANWTGAPFSYEDSANVAGLRLMLLYVAQKTSDSQEIRDTVERSVARFCTKNRENLHHNPLDVSINVAASEMPTFNSLYNCKPGDRMYVAPENYCKTLNMDIDVEEYKSQKIENDDLFVLTHFMDVLEDTAVELDAANITTFEGKLFDITVEEVEEQEESKEGSAESSSSSSSESDEESSVERELDEVSDGLDDSENETELRKSEIASTSRSSFIWPATVFTLLIKYIKF
ncbi:Peptidase_M13 domain-containing protein [Caenorhabditis elegans]|uniref:Peptidase_M13 domain-containing protein n=1 Tax=Caenorhabditis elegans TaxID=6239 RepID=Q09393_CAEEL|nr:Peptidase_M13 domain-containing protein [Caenorhabditis elegans]CAA88262.2 Peptidase_M13 domain-containing protein [Caenorhabditis elegans]|eukprot:NP_509681.2 Uncharacterized protein CELE_F42G10.1 [Caenorhabditis elegans]